MPKELKFFTNGRGWNYLPDFPSRMPGGDKVLQDERQYTATNSVVGFWRYYDEEVIEDTIQKLRRSGVNNIRVWFHYYLWEHYKNLDDEVNPYVQRIKHLVRTLEDNYMYCCWVYFDSLVGIGFQPTVGEEHLDNATWQYFPFSGLGRQSNFMDNSGIPYIEKMSSLVSASQASFLYEFANELKISQFTSSNVLKGVSAIYRCTSGNPNSKRAVGIVLQSPFRDIPGISGVGVDLQEQFKIHEQATGIDILTVHPYANFDSARSIQVDFALSAGYDLNLPIFFTEGAYALAFNSFKDWMRWCAASSLGWSIYQGMTPGVSGTVYRDQVGLMHSDGSIRLPTVYNYLTGLAISAGYDPEWIQQLRTKTDYSPLGTTNQSLYWSPPKGHPNSPLNSSWLPSSSPYYERYRLGGEEQELDEDIPIGFVEDWLTSAIDLSAVRNTYLTEAGSLLHIGEEYRVQTGVINGFLLDVIYYCASGWGVPTAPVSSYFSRWGLTNQDYANVIASSTEQALRAYPGCLVNGPSLGAAICDGTCFYGPNCVGGVFQNNGQNIFDFTAYTRWHNRLRNYICDIAGPTKMNLVNCTTTLPT